MRIDLFDLDLPERLIALRPLAERDGSRMLVVRPSGIQDAHFRDLSSILSPKDIVVVNNTRVVPVALSGHRPGRGDAAPAVSIDVTLIRRLRENRWSALAKPARRLSVGDRIRFAPTVWARVDRVAGAGEIELAFETGERPLEQVLPKIGKMPLPPYILKYREADARDGSDYQTVFAAHEGAIAAPTAGLHFSEDTLGALRARGVAVAEVTLHVGAGTFLPVRVSDTDDHRMHPEWGSVSAEAAKAINRAKEAGGRVVAIGTTSLRLMESAATGTGTLAPFSGETDLFITPGYRFRVVDLLLTNFHLPRSTLFMLVAAFAGLNTMKTAYAHAIAEEYRFYSYGDASLLFRHDICDG